MTKKGWRSALSASNKIQNVLKRAQQLDISPTFLPYSGVEIVTGKQDDEGKDIPPYFAGDRSGRVLAINNPWGTIDQANDIIAKIRGFTYQPYTADGALVDPSAELGDGVSVNDVYSGIYKMSRVYSSLMAADIEAPQSEEIDHEYPYESKATRDITRRFSSMESELAIASDKIEAKVSAKSPEGQTSFSWDLTSSSWEVKSGNDVIFKVSSSGAEVSGTITATSGVIGGFDISASSISFSGLTWNGTKQGIYIGTSGIQLGSKGGSYFQASSSGDVYARNIRLMGNLYMYSADGNTYTTINAQTLATKANSAYTSTSSGGYCYNASAGWNRATGTDVRYAVGRFNCKLLWVTGNVIYVDGTGAYWQEKEVRLANGGTSKIIYLGRATV